MYSPFRDSDGHSKDVDDVTYEDLAQLRELDEGFALEFKQTLDSNVEGHLPKIIASFSNSKGGWIVIGIRDSDKAVCPIPKGKADFSQMIGELCRQHVSPTPRFEMRFIEKPDDAEQGVLIIRVIEGEYPPYVADGVVEIRVGSASAPADGQVLVDLYDKSIRTKAAVKAFCHRTVYFPDAPRLTSNSRSEGMPLFDLYLYHQGHHTHQMPSRSETNDRAKVMQACFERQGMEFHCQHAHDSIIFRASPSSPLDQQHSAIELFGDESVKLSVPAVLVEGDDRTEALSLIRSSGLPEDRGGVRLMSATDTLTRVTRMATIVDRYVRARDLRWEDYVIAYELECMAGVILYSPRQSYLTYVRKHGVLFCGTTNGSSQPRYVDETPDPSTFQAHQYAGSHFFEACGLPLGSDDADDAAIVRDLLRSDD